MKNIFKLKTAQQAAPDYPDGSSFPQEETMSGQNQQIKQLMPGLSQATQGVVASIEQWPDGEIKQAFKGALGTFFNQTRELMQKYQLNIG